MTTYTIPIEVPDGTTPEEFHEDLCLVLHECAIPKLAYIDVQQPVDTSQPVYYTRVPIVTWDNRDPGETWLWYDEVHYISVSPNEVMGNMLENCFNEDVLFLFSQFTEYLDDQNKPGEDTRNDTSTDHIKGFHAWLSNMIAQSWADKMVAEDEANGS